MRIVTELTHYAKDCISGKIPSCQKHIWACERFLRNIKRKDWEYFWDEKEAVKIFEWFKMLRHSKGILARQPIVLTTSQKFFVCQIYGWRTKKGGKKRFTNAFKEVGRKNAKSQEQAGCLLYEIAVESMKTGELYETYCAGTKRDQSKIIFEECKLMLRGSPLERKFKITRDQIKHIKSGSFIKPLCKEDGRKGDGTNPACLVLDEYHQHETTEFYDLGLGGNASQTLLLIITTAGKNLNCPCYQQEYKYCSNILNPNVEIENDKYLVNIYESEKNDDINDINTWIKSNPVRASYDDGLNKIKDALEIAKAIPEKMVSFKTKILNIWVQAKENGYMDMEKWESCKVKVLPIDLAEQPVYVGFDMSAKIDLTSVSFIIPIKIDSVIKYIIFSHSFIPNRQKLSERIATDRVPYDLWEEQGFITVTNTPIVDQSAVIKYVEKFCADNNLKIQTLCFDPANASKMEMELSDAGYDVEEVYQSFKCLNNTTTEFREQVFCKNIIYLYNPVLNFAMANAITRSNSDGLIKIDKDATKNRIDPVDATLAGFQLARFHTFEDFNADTIAWLESEEW